ncbi:CPBP family intramembrane glutamic endopeptidase [uncultured Draconibacterium sp.]|uniref:CPBP family intramembrane glutamic endopeptidase n=1 Tax=uncultured Draconibacterium sp. TaxID=1573823 RepID=UPI002AA8951A|nr:CPBP family intramembrane glutamic endopeptidase [uncultured Draconibacterium sp.]
MIWHRNHDTSGFASRELILYPLLFGGGCIFLLLLLKRYFLKEPLKDFNSGTGFLVKDFMWSLVLTVIYFALFYLERMTLMGVLEFRSNQELLELMLDMREKPILIILWFLPVLWIGIALYEELIRVFMLTSLWKFSDSKLWTIIVIFLTSILVGLTHWSQGSYGIVTIAIKSLVACFFFFKYRRLMPLVIAHALYDGIQVAMLLIIYPNI